MLSDYEDSGPVMVPTFSGPRAYQPCDLRPWPERVAEQLQRLDARIRALEAELDSRRARQQWAARHDQAAP